MFKSEAVVIESKEVRELLRFLFYLDILNNAAILKFENKFGLQESENNLVKSK